MSNRVEDFMAMLKQQQPKTKEDFKNKNRSLEKIYLNFPGNFGRYQVLPMNSVVTDYPFVTLFNTREIQIPRKNLTTDGQENVYKAWIKILPKEAYLMKEPGTGRVVSSLTAAEDQLLMQAYMLYDQLSTELDAGNNRDPHITNLIRKRNYTIFHGLCLNRWTTQDPRTPDRQNFTGLFVVTAKGFINAIQNSIEEKSIIENGEFDWVDSIYNNQLTGRDGFLMFSLSNNPNQAGYLVTASHEINKAKNLSGVTISEEDAELMRDPVSSFLGWQANNEDHSTDPASRRLFNAKLIQEAITFLSQQLGAVRMAKQTGVSIADAIARTTEDALANQVVTNTMGKATNDPMLAQMASSAASSTFGGQGTVINPESVINNNTNPYQTPPVAHIDPITSAPNMPGTGFGNNGSNAGAAPFEKPAFATNFGGDSSDDLPF